MRNRRRIEPGAACCGEARDDPAFANDFGNFRCWNSATLMGTGSNEQRRVCFRHSLKVDSHGNHADEQIEGRFDSRSSDDPVRQQRHNFFKYSNVRRY
jgi:hypothetical protein